MRIEKIRLRNHKSFNDSGWISLGPRLNLIVGQNNSGKTALLESIEVSTFAPRPHKNAKMRRDEPINTTSFFDTVVSFNGNELHDAFMTQNIMSLSCPRGDKESATQWLEYLFQQSSVLVSLRSSGGGNWAMGEAQPDCAFQIKPELPVYYQFSSAADRASWQLSGPIPGAADASFAALGPMLGRSVYSFRAERMNLGMSVISPRAPLAPNASNLACCLLHLQANIHRNQTFLELVREIFPNVFGVSVEPISQNQAEIFLWNVDPSSNRDDLRIKLEECGTGVSQVLAMLYVVLEEAGRILVIDEPNSFLHPSAARKLVEIFKRYDHQYIISTHAPEIIAGTEPDTISLVRWSNGESSIETLASDDIVGVKKALSSVGVRLSDVFGADQVLWVEGQTEEKCFPLLIKAGGGNLPAGIAIVPVLHTGDFESGRNRSAMAFEIYQRLSEANALIPPAHAFVFDKEGRSPTQLDDLKRKAKVYILPRMMYENYLLHCEAIAAVINESLGESVVTEKAIYDWITKEAGKSAYYNGAWDQNLNNPDWVVEVNAAKLLKDLFSSVTDAKLEFRKTAHSVALTHWLITHKPDFLSEVTTFVKKLVSPE